DLPGSSRRPSARDDILDDEPQARARVRELLREIMTDELAHVGLRRNFMGAMGVRMAHLMVPAMYRAFFRDLPESRLLFDVDRMVHDGQAFDYSTISPEMTAQSWVPSSSRAESRREPSAVAASRRPRPWPRSRSRPTQPSLRRSSLDPRGNEHDQAHAYPHGLPGASHEAERQSCA